MSHAASYAERGSQSLGTKLRALRRLRGLSLRQVEAASGVSAPTISRAERDKGVPDTRLLAALAKFYGVSLASLLDVDEPTDERADVYLKEHLTDLEWLRAEMNSVIDRLRDEARAILAQKGQP